MRLFLIENRANVSLFQFQLLLSALLGTSTQSPIARTVRSVAFSRAAVEHSPRFILADQANWYSSFVPSQGYKFAKVASFSRSAVEQRPQLILDDPIDWYSDSWPNEHLTVPNVAFSRAAVESRPSPQLTLTNPANWFADWTPSQFLTLPVLNLPSIDFLSINWNTRPLSTSLTSSVASTTTETFVSSTTTTPSTEKAPSSEKDQLSADIPLDSELRIPVTTRKPGEPHHFYDNDNHIQYEILDGVHKISSNHQSFEIRYTKPNSGTFLKSSQVSDDIPIESNPVKLEDLKLEIPINTPIETTVQKEEVQTAPPLIRNSNDANDIHLDVTAPGAGLEPPQFEPKPFLESSIQWNQ